MGRAFVTPLDDAITGLQAGGCSVALGIEALSDTLWGSMSMDHERALSDLLRMRRCVTALIGQCIEIEAHVRADKMLCDAVYLSDGGTDNAVDSR